MLTTPSPDRAVQLDNYRRVKICAGHSEQVGPAFVGDGIGAAVLAGSANEVVAPDTMPTVLIMALATRKRQSFDLLGRRTTAPMPSDTAIVIPQGHPSWWASNEPKRNLHIHVQRSYLDRLDAKLHGTLRPRYGVRDPLLARLGRLIEASLSDWHVEPLLLDHVLLAYTVRALSCAERSPAMKKGGLSAGAERRCVDYLEARLAEKVTIAELAAVAGLSPFHFARMFRHSTGDPPARFQQRLRMEKAKTLLSTTDLAITDVAAAVGYETSAAFARAFRAHTGVAPKRWRVAR